MAFFFFFFVFLEGQRQIPFLKVQQPSKEKKPKALVGSEPRTEPVLGTGDSYSTSTPPPPICVSVFDLVNDLACVPSSTGSEAVLYPAV